MESGRFKVFRHLNEWFDEFRLYHRKDGKVFKERDDLMSATRYGEMMLRYASPTKRKVYEPRAVGPGAWMGVIAWLLLSASGLLPAFFHLT